MTYTIPLRIGRLRSVPWRREVPRCLRTPIEDRVPLARRNRPADSLGGRLLLLPAALRLVVLAELVDGSKRQAACTSVE
jgi:hypothetical protein